MWLQINNGNAPQQNGRLVQTCPFLALYLQPFLMLFKSLKHITVSIFTFAADTSKASAVPTVKYSTRPEQALLVSGSLPGPNNPQSQSIMPDVNYQSLGNNTDDLNHALISGV